MQLKEYIKNFDYKKNLPIISIFFIIISFPVNDKIFLFFRIQDLFVVLFVILNFFILNKKELTFLFYLFIVLIFTNIIGIIYFDNFYYYKLAIFYKIFFPLIFLLQFKNFINHNNYQMVGKIIDLSMILFLTFIYIFYGYGTAVNNFGLDFVSGLPIFPGSFQFFPESNIVGDRHMIGSLVALYFTIKFIINLRDKKYIISLLMFLFFINFMFVFSSRTFLIFLIVIIYLFLNHLFKNLKYKKNLQLLIYCLLLILIILINFLNENITNSGYTNRLFIFNEINIFADLINLQITSVGPHTERIVRFFELAPDNIFLYFTGVGFLYYSSYFLDSGAIFLFLSFGILPLYFLIQYIIKNISFNFTNDFTIIFLTLIVLIVNLLISEFFLVSRYIYLVIILLYYSSVKTELFSSENKNNQV
jgi:hypothetical protein